MGSTPLHPEAEWCRKAVESLGTTPERAASIYWTMCLGLAEMKRRGA